MTPNEGYQDRLRKFLEEERTRKERPKQSDEVKYSSLQVRMPLGCWILVGLFALAAYP